MTANKPMTGEQLDELMTAAVNMQRDAETDFNRPSAMFAYAVQVAVLQLRKVRDDSAALAAENGQMLRLLTDISENHDEYVNQDEYLYAGVPMDYVSEINAYVSRDVEAENPFKATDAFLAEVRAQGVEMFAAVLRRKGDDAFFDAIAEAQANAADQFAAQLRKGVQS
ncbi:hypothetical protein FR731_04400 [Enterobacter hormaechei]|uniref:hypothetical protein n=1 Tax=Enterobacter cloacae complex TaxID=354276 RepID=UPI0004498EAA|nr:MULTISPECIES: hypothetical protein [Enterobacter cloacae complex]EUM98065.1 hypothetical protein L350_05732 [Enterobacter sp. MGH 4]TWX82349.1 hypothetical protein FR731_04400 [Enterobacter hormaechei]